MDLLERAVAAWAAALRTVADCSRSWVVLRKSPTIASAARLAALSEADSSVRVDVSTPAVSRVMSSPTDSVERAAAAFAVACKVSVDMPISSATRATSRPIASVDRLDAASAAACSVAAEFSVSCASWLMRPATCALERLDVSAAARSSRPSMASTVSVERVAACSAASRSASAECSIRPAS